MCERVKYFRKVLGVKLNQSPPCFYENQFLELKCVTWDDVHFTVPRFFYSCEKNLKNLLLRLRIDPRPRYHLSKQSVSYRRHRLSIYPR